MDSQDKLVIGAIALVVALLIGWISFTIGKRQRPCYECCVEGEMCMDEDEWAKESLDAIGNRADADELSRLLDECWKEQNDLSEPVKAGLQLAKCKGALEECRRPDK